MTSIDGKSKVQPCVGRYEDHQFGLRALFAAIAFVCLELTVVRLCGAAATALCVHSTMTAAIVAWTKGHTWRGAGIGFSSGACLAGLLFVAVGTAGFPQFVLGLLTGTTFGSWIGGALHGMARGYALCSIALLLACHWPVLAMGMSFKG